MAKATLIRYTDGNKSALVAVRANAFQLSSTLVYIGAQPFLDAKIEPEGTMNIPDGFTIKEMSITNDAGEVEQLKTKNGDVRKTLVWL